MSGWIGACGRRARGLFPRGFADRFDFAATTPACFMLGAEDERCDVVRSRDDRSACETVVRPRVGNALLLVELSVFLLCVGISFPPLRNDRLVVPATARPRADASTLLRRDVFFNVLSRADALIAPPREVLFDSYRRVFISVARLRVVLPIRLFFFPI